MIVIIKLLKTRYVDVNKTVFKTQRETCLKLLEKIPSDGLRQVSNKLIARFRLS